MDETKLLAPKSIIIPRVYSMYNVLEVLMDYKGSGITSSKIHFKAEMSFAGVTRMVLPFLKYKGFVRIVKRDGRSNNVYITPAGEMMYHLIKEGSKYYQILEFEGLPE